MTYSSKLSSTITNTRLRTPNNISKVSGMCSVCTSDCNGLCEIGLSAVRGSEAIYPFMTDVNQFASEKEYPLDFSHFNINGKVFGAFGCNEDSYIATFPKVNINTTFGKHNPIKMKAPIILPAIAKLDWKDYYAGAALSGVLVVIGEDVVSKDNELILEDGKVVDSPLLNEMVAKYREFYNGYGDIIVQANYDDENLGVLEYAITKLGIKTVEIKFGQAAKGIQGVGKVKNIDDALKFQKMGYLVYPDPSDKLVADNYKNGMGQIFERIGKLPMWNEDFLIRRVAELRELGAEHICFKLGPFDPQDIIKILTIASQSGVDLVTLDGAGGGSGSSPSKMMNEWGIPTVYLESITYKILKKLKEKQYEVPQVAIAGGFAMEDQIFKGLALGAPYINFVAVGRAAMAAAFVGKQIGELINSGSLPNEYKRFGLTKEEVFLDLRELKTQYDTIATNFPTGAIGVYSYINRISTGLRQLMALNRKFTLEYIDRTDIYPLTELASNETGLKTYNEKVDEELSKL